MSEFDFAENVDDRVNGGVYFVRGCLIGILFTLALIAGAVLLAVSVA